MRIKLGKLIITWANECELQLCSYYTYYLRYGPPTLNHTAYHKAEADCLEWQKKAEEYSNKGQDEPDYIHRMCNKLEEEIRA